MESQEEKVGTPEEEKKWIKIYPIYMDKKVKYSEGRRINLDLCPENPSADDIYKVCLDDLKLICKLERKSHPRDWEKKGRVIVRLKGDDNQLIAGVANEAKTSK